MISAKEKKIIKSLQIKKYRQHHQAFLVEGWKSVYEVIQSDWEIIHLFVHDKFSNLCDGVVLKGEEINAISSMSSNTEALAVVRIPSTGTSVYEEMPIFLFDGIQDPGNLGTIVRTADWLGLTNIYCSSDSVDFYNPKTISATKGSFIRIQPHYVDIADFLSIHRENKIWIADMNGKDYRQIRLDKNSVVVFGNESLGVRDDIRKVAADKISIPRKGRAESLNVAISFSIIAASL